MPFKIRPSKYRHVYGNPHKEDVCYKNVKITKNAHDSSFCAVNPKFVAIVTEECGGGAFIVVPIKHTGRVSINIPKVSGHRGPVLDLKWNPFNDNEIASCSEDTTIKVWQVGDHGLYENLNDWIVDLHGHQRKVNQIEWHPTAENIILSSGADLQVILWNLEKAEPIRIITCHNDTVQSINWSRDGSFFATTCKDKKLRIIDPRSGQVIREGAGHQGSKISKAIVLGCGTKLFTTGFSKLSERQIALWNIKDLSKPIQMEVVDCSSGILMPYYDHDTKIVFVAGKGDGNIRYYEITDSEPYIHYLSEYKSATPQRGLGFMPKRGLDVTKNEIYRFYKLHATGGICEPISMIVPRKSEVFQEDIYPDTISGIPSLSCDEWIAGETREPILVSMKDGAIPFMPKIVTYKQLGFSDLGTNLSRSYTRTTTTTTMNNATHPFNAYSKGLEDRNSNHFIETSNSCTLSNNTRDSITSKSSSSSIPIAEVHPNSRSPFTTAKSAKLMMSNGLKNGHHHNISPPFSPTLKSKHNISPTRRAESHSTSSDSSLPNTDKLNSNESVNQMMEEDNDVVFSNNNNNINNKLNGKEELEASYLTSMSRNPVTLRKTESLKIDSVQSLRNRFNRISKNGSFTLKKLNGESNPLISKSFHDSNEKEMTSDANHNNNSNNSKTHEPNESISSIITLSPSTTLNQSSMVASIESSIVSSSTSTASYSEYFGAYNGTQTAQTNGHGNGQTTTNSNGICIKKRVWTPVQSNGNKYQDFYSPSNGSVEKQFSELQKAYHRLLEEKDSLKEQLSNQEKVSNQKDQEIQTLQKRINQLEFKLNALDLDPRKLSNDTDC